MPVTPLRIWLFQTGEPLPLEPGARLLRTGYVAGELARRGHEVWWFASAFEHQLKRMLFADDARVTLPNGVILQLLHGTGYRRNVSLERYRDHRQVATKFRRLAPGLPRPDVVAASLPCYFLAAEASAWAKQQGVPCLIDARDPWPDTFIDALPRPFRFPASLLLARDRRLVRRVFHDADSILAMSASMLDWALNQGGRRQGPMDGVFYNAYPRPEATPVSPPWLEALAGKTIVAYVGTFGRSYELRLLLESAAAFHQEGDTNTHFVLAGCGEQENALRQLSADLPNVLLPGWLNASAIAALLGQAAVGVAPCRSVPGALPNKIFEYLAFGLPVVSSLTGEMAEHIDRQGLGLNYRAGDAKELYTALRRLLADPAGLGTMSLAAQDFHTRYGSVDHVYAAYADHLENLAARRF